MADLKGKTLFITGGSRGIGKAIALRAAADGANVAIAAKTAAPHPKLPGTVYSACEEVDAAGGKGLPLIIDARDDDQLAAGVAETVKAFGGIDILINNCSAISISGTVTTSMKRYDLMQDVNTRATFSASRLCIPHLKEADNPHILTLSPPLNMDAKWFKNHVAYTISKYGMSMCVLGMAEELRSAGIAVNALWPATGIATAAIKMLGGDAMMKASRNPEIVADAAQAILTKPAAEFTGNFCIDEEVLRAAGVTDFDRYHDHPGTPLMPDFFLG